MVLCCLNFWAPFPCQDANGWSLLFYACEHQNLQIIRPTASESQPPRIPKCKKQRPVRHFFDTSKHVETGRSSFQHSPGGSGQSSRWIWRQRLRMASLAWTSSSVKGDLDVIGCINRKDGTGCSRKGGRSFSGNKLLASYIYRYVYICIIYFNWSRRSVSIHVSIDTWHDFFHDFPDLPNTCEWLNQLLAAFLLLIARHEA